MFGGLMGDFDDDPFFGGQMRRMNNMMNTMMGDFFAPPFGNMLTQRVSEPMDPYQRSSQELVRRGNDFGGMGLMPFGMGFPDLRSMFNMANNENCHSFSSSTVMTMTNGPDGRPQVYQASSSTRQAPGGVRETKKTVQDSRTGMKKMSIGHHIGDRAHVLEKSQNYYSGEQEENQELINLEEEETEDFNKEWEMKTKSVNPALTYGNMRHSGYNRKHRGESGGHLALPPAPSTSSSSLSRHYPTSSHAHHRSHSHPQLLSLPPPPTQTKNYRSEKTELGKKRKQHQQQHYEVSSTNSGGGGRLTDRKKKEIRPEEEEDETEEPKLKKRVPSSMKNQPLENDSYTDSDSN